MKNLLRTIFAATVFALVANQASATIIYNLSPGDANYIVQQTGNNMYYYGDDVTLTAGSPRLLNTVTLTYLLYSYTPASYTPNLKLDIFAIDPGTRLPVGGPIGTATVNNVTFSGGDGDDLPFDVQNVTFDFTGQNVILPTDFAFAYHDNATTGTTDEQNGFSVLLADPSVASVGSTVDGFLDSYTNDPSDTHFQFGVDGYETQTGNLWASIDASDASAAPEPATVTMLGMGVASLFGYGWRRRKVA